MPEHYQVVLPAEATRMIPSYFAAYPDVLLHPMHGHVNGRLTSSLNVQNQRIQMRWILECTVGIVLILHTANTPFDDSRLVQSDVVKLHDSSPLPLYDLAGR